MLTLPDKPLLQLFWSRVMQHLTLWMSLLRRIEVTNSYYYSWSRKFGSLFLAGEKKELCSWELMQAHMESLFYKKLLNITNNCIIDHISLKQILFRFFCGGKKKGKKQVLILPITKGFSATSSNTNAIMTWLEIPVQIEVWQEGRIQSDEEKRERERERERER